MPRKKSSAETPKLDDPNKNRVTKAALLSMIHAMEDRIDVLRSVIAELEKLGFDSIVTSNWMSSGLGGVELIRRATDAMWTAIGEEAALSYRLERMRKSNEKPKKDAQ